MMVRLALATFEDVLAHELAFKDDGIPITDRFDLRVLKRRRFAQCGPRTTC